MTLTPDRTATAFTFDTSGVVVLYHAQGEAPDVRRWPDLTLLAQGYIEAASRAFWESLGEDVAEAMAHLGHTVEFSDWSGDAVALILRDCEAIRGHFLDAGDTLAAGATAWDRQREGRYVSLGCPPRTPYLSDDGKLNLREARP